MGYHDFWKRGIHFNIYFSGTVHYFCSTYILSVVTDITVTVGLVNIIIGFLTLSAFGYMSKVHKSFTKEWVSNQDFHKRIAVKALSTNIFNALSMQEILIVDT